MMNTLKTIKYCLLISLLAFSFAGMTGCNNSDTKDEEYKATATDRQASIEMVADGFAAENDGEYSDITASVTLPTSSNSVGKVNLDTSFTTKKGLTVHVYKKFVNPSVPTDSSNKFDLTHTKLYLKRDIYGTIQKVMRSFYMEVNRHTVLTVEGLGAASNFWTLNGERTAYHFHSFKGRMDSSSAFSYERILNKSSLENVIVNKNDGDKFPESGTLSYDLTINKTASKNDKTKTASFSIIAKITFNGTNRPEIEVIDKQGHRLRYRVNVESGDLTPSLN